MALMSTSLKDELLGSSSVMHVLDGGYIHIYGYSTSYDWGNEVPAPPDPDLPKLFPETPEERKYVHIVTIKDPSSGGLNFLSPDEGFLRKDPNQDWEGTVVSSGTQTAAFFLMVPPSLTNPEEIEGDDMKIVGTVGFAGTDLIFPELAMSNGETQEISFFTLTFG